MSVESGNDDVLGFKVWKQDSSRISEDQSIQLYTVGLWFQANFGRKPSPDICWRSSLEKAIDGTLIMNWNCLPKSYRKRRGRFDSSGSSYKTAPLFPINWTDCESGSNRDLGLTEIGTNGSEISFYRIFPTANSDALIQREWFLEVDMLPWPDRSFCLKRRLQAVEASHLNASDRPGKTMEGIME